MTTHFVSLDRQTARGVLSRLVSKFTDALKRRRKQQRATEALESLPDYLLKDIGISRSQIRSAVMRDIEQGPF